MLTQQSNRDPHAAMQSAMDGLANNGYNYNISAIDVGKLVNSGDAAIQSFEQLPLSTPGLFNFPLCVVTNLQDMPDSLQINQDYYHMQGGANQNNPCSCADFNFTVPGTGEVQFFRDYVTANIAKYALCQTSG